MPRGRKPIPHVFAAGVETKRCGSCKTYAPLDQFQRSAKGWDGLASVCKTCVRAYRVQYEARLKSRPPSKAPQRCAKCRETKPAVEFYRCVTKPNGLASYCKVCSRKYTGARAKLETVKAVRTRWAMTKGKEAVKRYKERWPAKRRARELVTREVNAGRMVNPRVCSSCSGTERVEAHHDDYAMPYEVRWLCRWCHRAWHRINGQGRNAASSR